MAEFDYTQLDREAGIATEDFYAKLDQEAKGPVGIRETLKHVDIVDVLEHIPVPFNPYQGAEKVGYLQAKERLAENQYEKYAQAKYEMTPMGGYTMVRPAIDRTQDLTYVKQHEDWQRELTTRGVTTPQAIAHGILDVFPWVADIAISGGVRKPVTAAISKAIKSPKLATTMGLLANATVASALQPARFSETAATVKIEDPDLSESQVYTKAIKRLYIENLSEMTGQYITKGALALGKRVPFTNKLIEKTGIAWRKMFKKSADDLLQKISTVTGVNDLFGETGEERVNTILQGLVDADDFGAGKDASPLERIYAGLKQDAVGLGIEIPVLMVPTAGRYVAAKVLTKGISQEIQITPDEAAQIISNATQQIDPKATPEKQQEQLTDAVLDEVTTTRIRSRFPQRVTDQASLENVGEVIARHLGVETTKKIMGLDRPLKWIFNKKPGERGVWGDYDPALHQITVNQGTKTYISKGVYGKRGKKLARHAGFPYKSGDKVYPSQGGVKRLIAHELGHIAEPGFVKAMRRRMHTPDFVRWVEGGVKQLFVEREEKIRREKVPAEVPTEPGVKPLIKPKRLTRKQLLYAGHNIPNKLGWTDEQRRDFIEELIGQRSLKGLKIADLRTVIEALEEERGIAGLEMAEDDYGYPIQVGDRTTTMTSVMKEAAKDVVNLPMRVEVPKHITKKFVRKREAGAWKRVKEILWGKENSSKYHLANILGNTFVDVCDTNVERSRNVETGHLRSAYLILFRAWQDAEISNADLALLSKHANPRFKILQRIIPGMATEIQTIDINDKQYDVTWGELMDIYLAMNQVNPETGEKDGLRHLSEGGTIINKVETGAFNEKVINDITMRIENNPKAIAVINAFWDVGENVWKPSINNVSGRIENKDIAKIFHWWGLEVAHERRLPGKEEKFNVNLIENRGIFKDRTKSTRPLVTRDAFSRFAVFENAIAEYVGHAESSRIARTLINNPDLNNALAQKGYSDVRKKLLTIMERAQSLPKEEGAFGQFMAERLPGLYRAYLHFNPRVVVSQYTSVVNYWAFVDTEYMTSIFAGLKPGAIEKTLTLSDIAYDRFYMAHSSLAMGEAAKSDSVLRLFTHKAEDKNVLGITLRMADMGALSAGREIAEREYVKAQAGTMKSGGDSAIWWADKNVSFEAGWIIDEQGKSQPNNEDWARAIRERAHYLWQRSQPSWDKWNRSMMTSGLVRKVFFPFRTFHEKSLTILHEANLEYERSNKSTHDRGRQAKKYGAVLASYTLNTIIRATILGLLARKIKKPWQYVSDILEAPMSMFPILGTILKNSIGNFINVLIGEKLEFHGEAIEAFPARVINIIAQAPADFSIAAAHYLNGDTKEAKEAFQRAVIKIYKGVGTAEGVPVSEIDRVYKGWIKEEEEEEPPLGRRRVRPRRKRPRKR